jgi:hypothetical protein
MAAQETKAVVDTMPAQTQATDPCRGASGGRDAEENVNRATRSRVFARLFFIAEYRSEVWVLAELLLLLVRAVHARTSLESGIDPDGDAARGRDS